MEEVILPLRITLTAPPKRVVFSMQGKPGEIIGAVTSTGADLSFDFEIRVREDGNLLGKFTQGPPAERFIYICSGHAAGQQNTCWSRRAKFPLKGITWKQARAGLRLEARVPGTGKDGGPCCATQKIGTVPLVPIFRALSSTDGD